MTYSEEDKKCCSYWAFGIGGTVFAIAMIISFSLYFAGYINNSKENRRVIKTTCTIVDHQITEAVCYRKCNCYPVCSQHCDTDIDGHRSCSQRCRDQCSQCPYTCFNYRRTGQYTIKNEQNITYVEAEGKRDLRTSAQSVLDQKPIGYQYICYYDPENSANVLTSLNNVQGYLVSSIVFFVIMGLGGLTVIIGAVVLISTCIDCSDICSRSSPSTTSSISSMSPASTSMSQYSSSSYTSPSYTAPASYNPLPRKQRAGHQWNPSRYPQSNTVKVRSPYSPYAPPMASAPPISNPIEMTIDIDNNPNN